jgi:hypothetical protein
VDHSGAPEGRRREEGMLHVQEDGQEVGGAEDGAPTGAQDGANTTVFLHSSGSVRPPAHHRIREQTLHGKAWGVIFVCTSTSLAHVEIAETYSKESFLMAVGRFMALHGAPRRFQSDQGTQLVAASKQLATWDWTAVHEMAERMNAEWHIVPTGGHVDTYI